MLVDEIWDFKSINMGRELEISGEFIYESAKKTMSITGLNNQYEINIILYTGAVGIERLQKIYLCLVLQNPTDKESVPKCLIEHNHHELEKEIDILLQKERDSLELLETIPGISKISASSIIAEIGTSMDVFKTEKHISSWAGLCPKNNESAGKKKRSGIKSGNNWLRSMLCECAWSATKKKDSRFKNKYWSMVPRMGRKKALIAIANMMLRLIYHLLKTKSTYKELEIQYFIDKDKRREDRIIKELKSKGYLVEKDSLQMA